MGGRHMLQLDDNPIAVNPDVDPCTADPCENGGSCVNEGDGTHSCICVAGFMGDNCEEIDHCGVSNGGCNSGSCANGANGPVCTCNAGFLGDDCGTADPCTGGNTCA